MRLLAQSLSNAFGSRVSYPDANGHKQITRPQHEIPEQYRGLSEKARRAIRNYGEDACRQAFLMHRNHGEGAYSVGFYLGIKTRQADAAINAGREMCGGV